MNKWNPLNRIVNTVKNAWDTAQKSTVFKSRIRRFTTSQNRQSSGPQAGSSPRPPARATQSETAGNRANNNPAKGPGNSSGAASLVRQEELQFPFTFDDLLKFAERADLTITAQHEPYIHAIVDDLALAISVSQDNTWLLVKSEFPVPPPGLHNLEHIDTDPSTEEIDRQLHVLIDATNEWNSATMYPTAYVDRTGHQWVIRLDTTFFIAGGLTLSQFQSHIDTARFYTRGAITQLPTLIPPV
ncbi:MAG: YbjN domain-containing protein [Actinomycetaceae bacterium]|nr:YbjN domain-containing protein [Actinomycetaceae bacterium]